jgi:hypothetical protein
MNDDQLLELSVTIDNTLLSLCDKHKTNALSMSAVVMARLMLLCDSVGSGDDMRKLCFEVSGAPMPKPQEHFH